MQEFTKICLLVSVFAAIREIRPVEPFFTAFLTSPYVDLTKKEVHTNIYPWGTYSCLVNVVIVFLITDYLCYKPVIIGGSVAGFLVYTLLLGHPPIWRVQISQIFFGFFSGAHVAYFSYMYARIEDKRLYQKATGYARASLLMGKFFNGLVAQLCISFGILSYHHLLYMSVAGTVLIFSISLFFPPVKHSLYFHNKKLKNDRKDEYDAIKPNQEIKIYAEPREIQETGDTFPSKNDSAVSHLWRDFKVAFTNSTVIRWSSWLVFAKGCHFLVITYIQVLWQTVAEEQKSVPLMNGAVEATYTIISAAAAYMVARMSSDWKKGRNVFLILSCVCSSGLLFYLSQARNLWLVYAAYIAYGFVFQLTLTITESQIAQNLQRDSYALVFGFLSFAAFCVTSLSTVVLVQSSIFHLNVHQQFQLFSAFLMTLACVIAFETIVSTCCKKRNTLKITEEIA